MALEVMIILMLVDITPGLILILLRVSAVGASKSIKVFFFSTKLLQPNRNQSDILGINETHYEGTTFLALLYPVVTVMSIDFP